MNFFKMTPEMMEILKQQTKAENTSTQIDGQEPGTTYDAQTNIIEGPNLVKVVADNPDIKEGRVDVRAGIPGMPWMPYNYNPENGETND